VISYTHTHHLPNRHHFHRGCLPHLSGSWGQHQIFQI
jgi:hypothetical protein